MKTRSGGLTLVAALVALPSATSSALADPSASFSAQSTATTSGVTASEAPVTAASDATSSAASIPAASNAAQQTPSAQTTVAPSAARMRSLLAASSRAASPLSAPASSNSSSSAPSIAVGSHISGVVDTSSLGAPTGNETHWTAQGGGWAQSFENGWALVSDDGQGGAVTGDIASYFTSHGYVNATGWPTGDAVTDGYGTYQLFGSKNNVISGALMSSSAGTFRVFGGTYATYFGKNLRPVLGSPVGEESRWSSGGGGWAQQFVKGWSLYKSIAVNGYVPSSFPWPNLNNLGWPKGGPQSTCGGQGIVFEHGTWMSNGSTCSPAKPTPPVWVSGYTLYPGNSVNPGWNGVKAYLAEQSLKMTISPASATMGYLTDRGSLASRLQEFQRLRGLQPTGNLDATTFIALNTGYSFGVDMWKEPSQVSSGASRSTRANAAANFARAQANPVKKPYIWGGTGPMGYDCAGLVLQSLRAGGFDPKNVSNYFDVYSYSDLSNRMWNDTGEFKPISSSSLAVGDMAFWGSTRTHVVHHMAMYLGNGQWIQAINGGVTVSNGKLPGAESANGWPSANFFGYRRAIQ